MKYREIFNILREKTGISVLKCMKAADESEGDLNKAKAILLKSIAAEMKGQTWIAPEWLKRTQVNE